MPVTLRATGRDVTAVGQRGSGFDEAGNPVPGARLIAVVPPVDETSEYSILSSRKKAAPLFRLEDVDKTSVRIYQDSTPVLQYNYGTIVNETVPENEPRRQRACYVHPIWGMDGEILTDDFPKDHYHHHGMFWTWPHVIIGENEYSLWEDKGNLRQRFVKWLAQEIGPTACVLGFENGWFEGDRHVLTERVWITVYPADDDTRAIDVDLFLIPKVELTLRGAEGKSYGGPTIRFRPPNANASIITVPDGVTKNDLTETRLPWADFTTTFDHREHPSGAAIFISKHFPDYPPMWLTRHYGPLCVGWPGTQNRTLEAGKPVHMPYRVWIHRGQPDRDTLAAAYQAYMTALDAGFAHP
ncbi:hypothetical protein JCM19992_23360 [Thermostilla marina]